MSARPTIEADQMEPYRRAGMTLIPLHRYDHVDGRGRERGKSPRDGQWQTRPYDPDEVVGEAAAAGTNVGVRLDRDWVVLDVDPRNFGRDEEGRARDCLSELDLELDLELGTAPHTVTGSGGHHYWYRKPADVELIDSLKDFPGIELKSKGRQVVAAGSVHPNGRHYRWDEAAPDLTRAREMPKALLLLARRQQKTAGSRGAGELTPEQLTEALEQIPAEEFREHDRWRDLMMSCHHATAGEGRQEFIDWSCSDPQYADQAWQVGRRWDSLHHDGYAGASGQKPITARYLYQQAIARGGRVPIDPPEVDFEPIDADGDAGAGDLGERETPAGEAKTMLEEMNEHNCCVREGGKFRVFTQEFDPIFERPFFIKQTKTDFLDFHSNRRVEVPGPDGDTKVMRAGEWWINRPDRRQYKGVIFDPERTHDDWLNLWTGWAVQPARGDWSLLRQLVEENLCDGDGELFRYVMNWAAHMAQNPGRAAEVALCFRGEKGTGKSTWGNALTRLCGRHGLHISSPEHLTGRFNSHLRDVICLFADEAFWAGDKKGESVLKQLVTEPTIAYEAKGKDVEPGKNLIHVVIASNAEWVVPAGMDRERRFCVAEVNSARANDRDFFQRLHEQMDAGGTEALLYDLLTRPIKGWAPRDDVPQTRGLIEQKLRSMDTMTAWWYQKLQDGFLPNQRTEWRDGPTTVLKEYLRKDLAQAAKEAGWGRAGNETEFGLRLTKLAPGVRPAQLRAREDEYGVRADVKGRAMAYVLPPLDVCRERFEEQIGGKVPWPRLEVEGEA